MLICQKLNTCRPCVAAMLMYILRNSYSNRSSLFYEICIITENVMILVSFILQMLSLSAFWCFWRYKIKSIKKVSYSLMFSGNLLPLYWFDALHCVCVMYTCTSLTSSCRSCCCNNCSKSLYSSTDINHDYMFQL
jgi:hypothetical protein